MKAMSYLTLKDVHGETGISMVTLLKYKDEHAKENGCLFKFVRGEGRTMRFRQDSVPTFMRLKREGLAKRGRPRKVK